MATSQDGTGALYALGVAIIVGALLFSAAVFFSIGAVSDAVSKKQITVKYDGAAPAGGSADVPAAGGSGPVTDVKTVDGSYKETTEQVCIKDGKLQVRMFATTWCPHCKWEKPVITAAAAQFGGKVDLKIYDVDATGSTPDAEQSFWQRYNPGGSIPTIVIGCKYYKIGSGETLGEDGEKAAITKLICTALGNDAPAFCNK